jgi:VWFA-related protein
MKPCLAFFLAASFVQGQTPGSGANADPDAFRISVDVDLVVLQATVRDRAGHTVTALKREDLTILEDGKPQTIRLFRREDTAVTVGLVVDHSGSMAEKLAEVTAAARAFVQSSNSDDRMFVVNFNEKVSLGLPAGVRFSDSAEQLGYAIWSAPAIGMTALYDATALALRRLQESTHDKKVLIVISDGGDNASKATLDQVLKLTEQSNATIYTIGIFEPDDPDKNPTVLRRLAKESGGEAFFPVQLSETVEICKLIARDIRDQYTIGYSSTSGKRDGVYHKIRVSAQDPAHNKESGKLFVRTRAGYSTGLPPPSVPAAR